MSTTGNCPIHLWTLVLTPTYPLDFSASDSQLVELGQKRSILSVIKPSQRTTTQRGLLFTIFSEQFKSLDSINVIKSIILKPKTITSLMYIWPHEKIKISFIIYQNQLIRWNKALHSFLWRHINYISLSHFLFRNVKQIVLIRKRSHHKLNDL